MPAFTMPLKEVIQITGGTTEIVDGVSKLTGGNIGLSYYPIFDEAYRDSLTGRIIDHYWNREIGQESISMFQLAMRRRMNEIMPYYNQLYKSTLIEYDALSTINIHSVDTVDGTQDSTNNATSNSSGTGTGSARTVTSETPQTQLQGNADYATGASDVNSLSTNESTGTQSGTENQTNNVNSDHTTTGYQGAAADLIMRYRESLINVDLMVIAAIEDLFMLVWDNGDSYTRGYML